MMYVGLGVIFAAVIAYGLRRRYQIKPGRAARIYSAAIVVLCVISVGFLALLMSGDGPNFETYDGFTPIFIVLVVHLVALFRSTPPSILVAISLMIGLLVARVLYTAIGWLALPHANELVSLGVSVALLAYVISSTFRRPIVSPDGNPD